MKSALVSLCAVTCVSAADLVEFKGSGSGEARAAGMMGVGLAFGGIGGGAAVFGSFSVEAEGSGSGTNGLGQRSGSASSDAMMSVLYASNGVPPSLWMAYYSVQAEGSADWSKNDGLYGGDTKGSVDASAGVQGHVYLDLQETKPDGTVVKTISLGACGYSIADVSNENDLHQATLKSSKGLGCAFGSMSLEIQVIGSSKKGSLSSGAYITPASMETVITLDNIEYTDSANSMVLRVVTGAAQAEGSASGDMSGSASQMTSGKGDGQMYIQFAGNAEVDGKANAKVELDDVSFSGAADGKIDGDLTADASVLGGDLQGTLSGTGSGSAGVHLRLVKVKFPAGAKKVMYDPTFGHGAPPMSAGATVALVIGIIAVVLLLAVGAVLVMRKSQAKKKPTGFVKRMTGKA